MNHVAIAGTGLIGASIGLGLSDAGWVVTGWDPDPAALAAAAARGAVRPVETRAALLAGDADVLVLAGPAAATIDTIRELDRSGLVVDVAGAKERVVEAAGHLPRFVGTHPMAGREISGPQAASGGLFHGAAWVVTTDGATESDLATVEAMVSRLGARPVRMTAAEHDAVVAHVSHVPQLIAGALMRMTESYPRSVDLAAGSFRDLTRVAASDPVAWIDVLRLNRAQVGVALAELHAEIDKGLAAIDARDEELRAWLDDARAARRELAASTVGVRVALADQPGELARVGRAFAAAAVDVRDLQLRHAPHGGGGILTISVRPGDAGPLRAALDAEGLILAD